MPPGLSVQWQKGGGGRVLLGSCPTLEPQSPVSGSEMGVWRGGGTVLHMEVMRPALKPPRPGFIRSVLEKL